MDYYIDFENYLGSDAWGVVLYYNDGSGNIEYICKHVEQDASTGDDKWEIHKIIYSSGDIVRRERLIGSVDGRAALGWR